MKSKVYALAINQIQKWDNPDCLYEVARVIKKDTGEVVIGVYYCKNAYQFFGYHFSVQQINKDEIAIVHDDLYLGLSNTNTSTFDAMLMHEVGHFVNGDMENNKNGNEIQQERILGIMKGKVAPEELAADRFAVEHCGKSAVMNMLDVCIATRKKRNTVDLEIALKEFELRKKAVKNM